MSERGVTRSTIPHFPRPPRRHLPPQRSSFSSLSYPQYSGVILLVYSVNLPLYASDLPRLSTSLSPSDPSPSMHHSIYTGIVVLYKLLAGKIYAPSYSDIHTYSDIRTYRTAPELNQKQEVRQAPASHPAAQFKAGREAGAGAISPCAGVEGCRGSTTAPG